MSTNNHEALLARLQQEVNLVLEHTGRVFAAANANPKNAPVAHAAKLKQILPASNDRFHDALDQLEDELHTAKLVMRRDLALCREQSGLPKPLASAAPVATTAMPEKASEAEPKIDETQLENPVSSTEDVMMQDSEPADVSMTDDILQGETAPGQDVIDGSEQPSDSQVPANTSNDVEESNASGLRVDTQSQAPQKDDNANSEQQTQDDQPPDTGTFSNTNDLESLFGAPLSAEAGDAPELIIDSNNDNADFDFDAFASNGTDNDNIAALLPGLQDYANNQPTEGGGADFDALFATDMTAEPEGQEDGEEENAQHLNSTFDDLFDLTDFNADDFSAGGQQGENKDFDFNFD